MSVELPIALPTARPLYFCPGEDRPISQTVHEARLAARWPGCASCPDCPPEVVRKLRSHAKTAPTVVHRTRWGVRGAWQNAITRVRAEQLTEIFTSHLCRQRERRSGTVRGPDQSHETLGRTSEDQVMLIVGYDGRASSPDIFAGVISAALQNGCRVLDVGRATVASVLELCRRRTAADAAVIVTGAGGGVAATGFDFFDRAGNGVRVPWPEFGVCVRRPHDGERLQTKPPVPVRGHRPSTGYRACAADSELVVDESRTAGHESAFGGCVGEESWLLLPPVKSGSAARFRMSRTSGRAECRGTETGYRMRLKRWFPAAAHDHVACVCFDPLVAERLRWLGEKLNIPTDVVPGVDREPPSDQLVRRVRETRADWGVVVAEDDRYLLVANRQGQCLTQQQLSNWINVRLSGILSHLTAHVPDGEDRMVLLDTASPDRGAACDVISDALVQLGILRRLVSAGASFP